MELFLDFPARLVVGTDTYTPERWSEVAAHAEWARGWLSALPAEVARQISYPDAETLARWPGGE